MMISGIPAAVRRLGQSTLIVIGLACAAACSSGGDGNGGGSPPPPSPPPPPANSPPTVSAGADQSVLENAVVQLAATASDPDNDPLTFAWSQTGGTVVTLTGADTAQASFTAPDVPAGGEDLSFRLTVDDGNGGSSSDDVVVTVQEPAGMITLSGVATYERPMANLACDGLDFGPGLQVLPIRGATVEIIDSLTNTLITSTSTSETGAYSAIVEANREVLIRIRSELVRTGTPAWEVAVRDNTQNIAQPLDQRPQYFLDKGPINLGNVDQTEDLLAATGWDGTSYSGPRAAAPFAVLDTIYVMMQLVLTEGDPTAQFPALDAFWSPNNTNASAPTLQEGIDTGQIGTSFYIGGSIGSLFLLGRDGVDAEEFDRHVIAHEWGHYFEDRFSRSDSLGGPHTFGDVLDPRLAFGEGFGNAIASIGLEDPDYCDTLWFGGRLTGFGFSLESEVVGINGWFNEFSIARLLYDLWDDDADGADTASIGFGPMFDVLVNEQRTTSAFTSVFSFFEALKAQPGVPAAFVDALLAQDNIAAAGINAFAVGETNDAGRGTDVLPVYTDLALGATERICSTNVFDDSRFGNTLGKTRFLRIELPAPTSLSVTIDTVDPPTQPSAGFDCTADPADPENRTHSDPDFELWQDGLVFVRGLSCQPNQELVPATGVLSAGTWILELTDFRHDDPGTNTPGGFPQQICFDVTVSP